MFLIFVTYSFYNYLFIKQNFILCSFCSLSLIKGFFDSLSYSYFFKWTNFVVTSLRVSEIVFLKSFVTEENCYTKISLSSLPTFSSAFIFSFSLLLFSYIYCKAFFRFTVNFWRSVNYFSSIYLLTCYSYKRFWSF